MADAVQREGWPGAASIQRRIPPGWYTRSQVAKMVGRSLDTIIRWSEDGTAEPDGFKQFGKTTVYLYSEARVAEMKQIAKTKKRGRRPKSVA